MTVFRHHPDGWIYVGDLCLPLDFFLTLESGYSLPEGARSREYIPGDRHSLFSSDSQWGGEFPWEDGDRYLSKRAEYGTAWEAYSNPPPTLEQLKAAKLAELDAGCQASITSGFYSSALGAPHFYSSKLEDQLNITGARAAGIDIHYVCTDETGLKTTRLHTAAQMAQVFFDGVARKQTLVNQFHALRLEVEAATTAAEVAAIAWTAT